MTSEFLRSVCCEASIIQTYDAAIKMFPIHCRACGQELGAAAPEDVPASPLRILGHRQFAQDMLAFKIGEMIAAQARTSVQALYRVTGV